MWYFTLKGSFSEPLKLSSASKCSELRRWAGNPPPHQLSWPVWWGLIGFLNECCLFSKRWWKAISYYITEISLYQRIWNQLSDPHAEILKEKWCHCGKNMRKMVCEDFWKVAADPVGRKMLWPECAVKIVLFQPENKTLLYLCCTLKRHSVSSAEAAPHFYFQRHKELQCIRTSSCLKPVLLNMKIK